MLRYSQWIGWRKHSCLHQDVMKGNLTGCLEAGETVGRRAGRTFRYEGRRVQSEVPKEGACDCEGLLCVNVSRDDEIFESPQSH